MLKYPGLLLLAMLFMWEGICQTHGLQFSSHEVVPEKRTALNLTSKEPFCFDGTIEINFDFTFRPNLETYFGYVVRIIADGVNAATGGNATNSGIANQKQNIDIVYNQRLLNFNFIIGETSNVFELDSVTLHSKWNNIRIRFDRKTQRTSLYVNGQIRSESPLKMDNRLCLKILFGLNDSEGFQTVDLPPMQIRNIRITESGALKHSFPLSEVNGNEAIDSVSNIKGIAKNPIWIKPKHQHWQEISAFSTAGSASVAFDDSNEILYIISRDSLYQVSMKNMLMSGTRLAQSRVVLPPGNQAVFDRSTNKLINFYIDEKQASIYDPAGNKWDLNFTLRLLTEFWQANKFLSAPDSSLYVVGGYGQLQYKNSIYRYHFSSKKWDTIAAKGDFFMPRYLAALGTNATRDTAYILGGYGSNTGDQKINPKHSYDLMAYSVRSGSFKKLQQLEEPAKHFAFGNSLVIDSSTRDYYSLVYARDRFNSSLQLLKGSLNSGAYQLLGDTIPYEFHDIESFADLFYAPSAKKLLAVTLFTGKDSLSVVRIYTLDFPPNEISAEQTVVTKNNGKIWIGLAIAGFVGLAMSLGYLIKRQRRKALVGRDVKLPAEPGNQHVHDESGSHHGGFHSEFLPGSFFSQSESAEGPAIFLFGPFHVTDPQGNDITRQFTPLLKELFLLILINSIRETRGISSEALTEVLWHNKSEKDAKNNRSVNIAKLKSIVEKLGSPVVTKESGLWKFQSPDNSVYIDFAEFTALQFSPAAVDRVYIEKLLNIVRRGNFLSQTEYSWLDDVKSSISNTIIDLCIRYIEKVDIHNEAEFIIEIANCIFHFDRLNEQALEYKCKSLIILKRHALANTTYLNFTKEYKEIYQEDFPKTFNEIIK